MSLSEKVFLAYVVVCFAAFGVALLTVSLWSQRR